MPSGKLPISGILLLLVAGTALAQVSTEPSMQKLIPRQHRPRYVAPGTPAPVYDPIRHVTVSYDTIWAGYAVTGTDFTYVQGSWRVSAVDCTQTPNSFSSEWVGIDGWSSDTVEQTGTDADCIGKNPFYYVWYEFYPVDTIVISDVSITPGDRFSAWVSYDGDKLYTVSITNETTGQSFSTQVAFAGAGGPVPERNSAEWIEEMDGPQLADFGTDRFGEFYTHAAGGSNSATDSGVSGIISDFGDGVQLAISTKDGANGGPNTAVPSPLDADGASFKVTWKSE